MSLLRGKKALAAPLSPGQRGRHVGLPEMHQGCLHSSGRAGHSQAHGDTC